MKTRPRVIMACFDQGQLLDMAGPIDCFDIARSTNPASAPANYEIVLVSSTGGLVQTSSGVYVNTDNFADLTPTRNDTVIIAGGVRAPAGHYPELVTQIRRFATKAKRLCSVCTGAYIIAQAGLADGGALATHWRFADDLQKRFPRVKVESDAIFCRNGKIWSSAGITAGIDMTLAILEEDLGSAVAAQIAKDIVVYLRRPGGQSQFSQILDLEQGCSDSRFGDLIVWILDRLDTDLSVERLADKLAMSPRNFTRICKEQTGETPARLVEKARLESARRLLEASDTSINTIARRCGFGREENLRRTFRRYLKTTPLIYRQHHATLARVVPAAINACQGA